MSGHVVPRNCCGWGKVAFRAHTYLRAFDTTSFFTNEAFVRKRVRFEGSSLRSRDEGYQRKLRNMFVEHALPRLRKWEMKVYVEKVLPWERIVEAHELMESNRTKGKIICTID
ncbi:MAG: hypothetical protein L6R35_001988 [Caloplaca aegaea]|nr:MAG: hypothetical protein L6R35_001988 [Caloplaca aegaea]